MIKAFIAAAILSVSVNLYGLVEGRIAGNKIPSITSEVSLEKSEFLYNAPVVQYININFGLMVNRFQEPGLSFGIDFQWLDAQYAAGTVRTNMVFLTNRSLDDVFLGGYLDLSLTAGPDISGFKGIFHTIVTASPGNDPLIAIELQLGAYVSPHESFNLLIAPAAGKYFVLSESFYFNLILSLEVFLWK